MPGSAWKPILAVVSALAVAAASFGIALGINSPSKASALPTEVTTTKPSECPSPKPHNPDKGYYYVTVLECGDDFKEASATLTLPQKLPKVGPVGHSIGEIAISHSTQTVPFICDTNAIEAGWIVEYGKPLRFFVFKTVGKQWSKHNSGYAPGRGWVSLGVKPQPNEEIPAGQPLKLRIHYDQDPASGNGRWYVSVNDKDVGYYRAKDWSDRCGAFKPDRIQWYGEVSTATPSAPCVEMGNGFPGSDSRALGFTQLRSAPSTEFPLRHIVVTDPNLYSSDRPTSGKYYEGFIGDFFRYGGRGKCEAQPKSEEKKLSGNQGSSKDLTPNGNQEPIEEPTTLVNPITGFDPTSGRPGSTPNLFGGGFYPNKDITITESSPAGSRPVGVITADASGSFDIMFQIPVSTPAGQIAYTFRQEPDVEVADTFLVGGEPVSTPEPMASPEEAAPTTEETPTTEPSETPTSAPTETATASTPEPSEAAKATTAPGTTPSASVPFYTLAPTP